MRRLGSSAGVLERQSQGACSLPVVLLLALLSAPASAQTLEGRVLDGASRQPVSDVRLILLHPDGRVLGQATLTDDAGVFSLAVPGTGEYFIRVERSSYTPIVDGVFEFTATDGRMEIEVFILPQPVQIEGFQVRVNRPEIRRNLRAQGFYDRAAQGFGNFIPPEEIERRGVVFNVSDYMRGIPGVSFSGGLVLFKSLGARSVLNADGQSTGMCQPNVWVDGIQMIKAVDPRSGDGVENPQLGAADMAQSLDDFLSAPDIAAIEVYRHVSSTPLQWGGFNGSCGTIVIWTQQGD